MVCYGLDKRGQIVHCIIIGRISDFNKLINVTFETMILRNLFELAQGSVDNSRFPNTT